MPYAQLLDSESQCQRVALGGLPASLSQMTRRLRTPAKEVPLRHFSVSTPFVLACAGALLAAACKVSTSPPTGVCDKVGVYVVGDTARDSLATGDCQQSDGTYIDFWNFSLDGQGNLRLSLSSPTNPAIVQVFDSRGAIIANSYLQTTGAADTSASLKLILGAGTYGIGVRGVTKGARGPYRFVVSNDTTPVAGCTFTWVTTGTTIAQRILSSDCTTGPGGPTFVYHVYSIVLLQGQSIDLVEHSTAFTPQMFLVGSTGTTSSSLDSTQANALISFSSAGQGLFQLWVGSATAASLGRYTLTLQ